MYKKDHLSKGHELYGSPNFCYSLGRSCIIGALIFLYHHQEDEDDELQQQKKLS